MLSTMITEMSVFGAGLSVLKDNLINDWLGPLFLIAIAVFAIKFIKDRQWMQLVGFVGIAAVVGVLIFAGDAFFGEDGGATKTAKDFANDITDNASSSVAGG